MKLDTDLPYGMTAITFRFPGSDNPDFAAAQILSDVLSSQRGKLYDLVPQGKALFAEFAYDTMPKAGLGYAIAGFPAGADSTNLLEQVRNILAAEITNGVTADLVEAAKRREISGRGIAEKFRSRPGLGVVAGRRRRRPAIAGRRHQCHPPGHRCRRQSRRENLSGF